MPTYYINKNTQFNGDNEVHEENCRYLPHPQNRVLLGSFPSCKEAVAYARRYGFTRADGCAYCVPECHTS